MSEPTVPFSRRPLRVRRFLLVFFVLCGAVAAVNLVHPAEHVHFPWEKWPFFYGVYGFVSCVLLVLVAKHVLRPLVMRPEDYYGDDEP